MSEGSLLGEESARGSQSEENGDLAAAPRVLCLRELSAVIPVAEVEEQWVKIDNQLVATTGQREADSWDPSQGTRRSLKSENVGPPLLTRAPEMLLHSMLFAHHAMVEQLAGEQTPWEAPEAPGEKKGSSSSIHRLGSAPVPCQLGPCCHLGRVQGELPGVASFTPPLPPPLPSDWTCLSGPFLPPLPSEQQLPGAFKPDILLPGPRSLPGAWHFPGFPLLAGLGQGAGDRLWLLSLRPEGLEVKPAPMMRAKGCLDPREGFCPETCRLKTGEERLTSPSLENLKALWPLDPP
ncbi:hypothetical protein H8959_018434 [Pygathrix nigripes]